jgi:hypothetical protein
MFVIRWIPGGYVTKRSSNRKPYASISTDPDVKIWTSKNRAQRWLDGRDETYATQCVIEEI